MMSKTVSAEAQTHPNIKVVAIGGGAINAQNHMIDCGMQGLDFIAVGTDGICNDEDTEREYYTPEKLVRVLEQDDIYFKMTGGGVVFGGGEPLLQADFIHKVCKLSERYQQLA